jgi:hypothetical protein
MNRLNRFNRQQAWTASVVISKGTMEDFMFLDDKPYTGITHREMGTSKALWERLLWLGMQFPPRTTDHPLLHEINTPWFRHRIPDVRPRHYVGDFNPRRERWIIRDSSYTRPGMKKTVKRNLMFNLQSPDPSGDHKRTKKTPQLVISTFVNSGNEPGMFNVTI